MAQKKIVGIVLTILGIGLAVWAYRLSGGFGSQVTQAFTGSPTDQVMMFYIGGAISLAVGLFLLLKK
jgi:cytosine/uracil/thiamine/allantoin permease